MILRNNSERSDEKRDEKLYCPSFPLAALFFLPYTFQYYAYSIGLTGLSRYVFRYGPLSMKDVERKSVSCIT
jgi:hypothetical protein